MILLVVRSCILLQRLHLSTTDKQRQTSNDRPARKDFNGDFEMTDAELTQPWLEVRQAADQLRKFYASGVSFFTKASLADLASQLEHANKSFREGDSSEGGGHGDTFVLRRLDGKAVEIKYKKRTPCKMPGSNKAVM